MENEIKSMSASHNTILESYFKSPLVANTVFVSLDIEKINNVTRPLLPCAIGIACIDMSTATTTLEIERRSFFNLPSIPDYGSPDDGTLKFMSAQRIFVDGREMGLLDYFVQQTKAQGYTAEDVFYEWLGDIVTKASKENKRVVILTDNPAFDVGDVDNAFSSRPRMTKRPAPICWQGIVDLDSEMRGMAKCFHQDKWNNETLFILEWNPYQLLERLFCIPHDRLDALSGTHHEPGADAERNLIKYLTASAYVENKRLHQSTL